MPGSPLPIVYPYVGQPVADALARVIAAIQTIQTDVEAKIVPSEFSWTSDLSAQGHALTSLSKIQLDNIASMAGLSTGTVFFSGGEAWVQTGFGAVQVTLNGAINSAGVGGIVGDYGGSNPARVTYTDSTDTYTFTADTNDWSDLEVQAIKLRNNGNWTKLQSDASLSTAQLWQLGAANASGTALLHQGATGIVGSGGTVTQNLNMSGKIAFTGSGYFTHGQRFLMHQCRLLSTASGAVTAADTISWTAGGGGPTFNVSLPTLEQGWRVQGFTIYGFKGGSNSLSFTIEKLNPATGTWGAISLSPTTTTTGAFSLGSALNAPETYVSGTVYRGIVSQTAGNSGFVWGVETQYEVI